MKEADPLAKENGKGAPPVRVVRQDRAEHGICLERSAEDTRDGVQVPGCEQSDARFVGNPRSHRDLVLLQLASRFPAILWQHGIGPMSAPEETGQPRHAPGDVLAGKYRIERLIGRGGMAEVYAAHHEMLNQTVAIKMLLPDVAESAEASARFLNEARAAARVRGEHIASVMDVGTLPDGTAYMVLEYLEGKDLEDYATEHRQLPVTEAVDYLLDALQALAQAHAVGIVHRDLKPGNLFLARRPDGSSIVKVLDFGISKVSRAPNDVHVTATSVILGSPFYMAPEQARSAKSVDARADIWAIGVILYRLLSGAEPLRGESLTDLLLAIVQDEPKPLRELRPDAPEELAAVIDRCMRKKPDDRYQNVGELALALAPFGGPDAERSAQRITRMLGAAAPAKTTQHAASPIETAPRLVAAVPAGAPGPGTASSWGASSAKPERPSSRRSTPLVVVAGVAAVALVVGVLVFSLRGKHEQPATTPAAVGADTPAAPVVVPSTALTLEPPPEPSASTSPSASSSTSPPPSLSASASARPATQRPVAPPAASGVHSRPATSTAAPSPPASTFDFLNQRN